MTAPNARASRTAVGAVLRRVARRVRGTRAEIERRVAERSNPTLRWLRSEQRRHAAGVDAFDRVWENRRRLIESLAPGRSFVDVGGMWGICGEMAFLAEKAGASRVVIFDGMHPTDEFDQKHRGNASQVQYVQADLHDADAVAALGTFDVVWCTGVIYHSPNPMELLLHLRRLTREYLVLGTHVIPEVPSVDQACVLFPGGSDDRMDTFARVHGGPERFPGMASPFDATPLMAYTNMWWGISRSALRAMLQYSGFDISVEYNDAPFWSDVLATPGGQSIDIYPAPGLLRGWVRDRHADTPLDQVPPWAAMQVSEIRAHDNAVPD